MTGSPSLLAQARRLANAPRKLVDLLTGAEWEKWSRVVMNREMEGLARKLRPETLRCLEISGHRWRAFGFNEYSNTTYPGFDVCTDRPNGEPYDIVVADQVFEHLLWPYRAARNVWSMLRPGGYFLLSTPFLVRIHDSVDCTRWTETGLKYFLAEAGFPLETTRTGAWGNRACVKANLRTMQWVRYRRHLHSLDNEPLYPYVVWALAQRPMESD
jgi:SAM-dependent methyltransferase